MNIAGSTVLVTGGNRGLGLALVTAVRAAGCAKVYVGARRPDGGSSADRTELVKLDITDPVEVTEAAERCADIDILINNAGVAEFVPLLGAPSTDAARREMETNYFGTLTMCRAFAPVLKRNGGGALINVLSVASWLGVPMQGSYCASKAAAWSLTRSIRIELQAQNTFIAGVFVSYIDTDMTAGLPYPKVRAEDVAAEILSGIEADREEILADARSRTLRSELLGDHRAMESNLERLWRLRDELASHRAHC